MFDTIATAARIPARPAPMTRRVSLMDFFGLRRQRQALAALTPEQLADNGKAVIAAIVRAKPASAKGIYLRSATLSATISPGLPLDASAYEKN